MKHNFYDIIEILREDLTRKMSFYIITDNTYRAQLVSFFKVPYVIIILSQITI